jgi:hypothetical protein
MYVTSANESLPIYLLTNNQSLFVFTEHLNNVPSRRFTVFPYIGRRLMLPASVAWYLVQHIRIPLRSFIVVSTECHKVTHYKTLLDRKGMYT